MRILEKELENKLFNYNKLLEYGFKKENENYIFKKKLSIEEFEVNVIIEKNILKSFIIDLFNNEEYILVDVESSTGEFVGSIKEEYENIIKDIIISCTSKNIFKSTQALEVIKYIKKEYKDELEYLWKKFPNNAVWRNKNNKKWYGALLVVSEDKLGLKTNNIIEILDLRYQKEDIDNIVDNKLIFKGYHMNKKSWITIKLDGSIDIDNIYAFIDNSYKLATKNKSGLSSNELSTKVYEYLKTIPNGKVVTYKQVAEYLGNKGLARVVGNILHKNPDGDEYPCYKVLNSKGELADEFVFGGKSVQKERLEKDGIKVINNKVDLEKYQWK